MEQYSQQAVFQLLFCKTKENTSSCYSFQFRKFDFCLMMMKLLHIIKDIGIDIE